MKPKSLTTAIFSILIILLMSISNFTIAQVIEHTNITPEEYSTIISGKITNAVTENPIAHVEVFVSGTTIGCITNTEGEFELKLPFIPCTLIANHISYDAHISTITVPSSELKISLTPNVKRIKNIDVKGKNKRKRNLRLFYSHFIGNNLNQIKILNDSVLNFTTGKKEFIAYTKEPLLIENKNLGYKIKVVLQQFSVTKMKDPKGQKLDLTSQVGENMYQVTGGFYYEEMKSDSRNKNKKFENNRSLQYFGSYRHFLKAIYDEEIENQGFQVEIFSHEDAFNGFHAVEEILENAKNENYRNYILGGDSLLVTYSYGAKKYPVNMLDNSDVNAVQETSTIYPGDGLFKILKNGTSPNVNFSIKGSMGKFCIPPNSLPDNYRPPTVD